jgi:hypothetical protein
VWGNIPQISRKFHMFSRFFGKRDKSEDSPTKEAQDTRGLEVIEDDPDTAWKMWNSAMKAQEGSTSSPSGAPAAPESYVAPSKPVIRPPFPARPVATAPEDVQLDLVLPTAPMELQQATLSDRKNAALETVELHHKRIANTIRTLWGYKECSVYINKLIMAGGDGMGHARVGFNQEAVEAMLVLSDLHDAEFGPPDSIIGGLGLSI